jgi:1-deoxy-D-xylulose-5-phosphate synthase
MWDMSILSVVPGLHLAAPRDGTRLREALAQSLAVEDAPSVIRFPRGSVSLDLPAVDELEGMDVLLKTDQPQALVMGLGPLAETAVAVGERLSDQGIGVTVVDPVWALPVNPSLLGLAADHELVITIEDNSMVGGSHKNCVQPGSTRRYASSGSRRSSYLTAAAPSCWRRSA